MSGQIKLIARGMLEPTLWKQNGSVFDQLRVGNVEQVTSEDGKCGSIDCVLG
jgi:hypothetical protein